MIPHIHWSFAVDLMMDLATMAFNTGYAGFLGHTYTLLEEHTAFQTE